jgi:tetratricopeptide (TPR) repeat protein
MSLLLDALKKAERAKQDAQRQAESESAASPPEGGLSIEQPAAEDAPVRTRDQLPDISQPLEIESEDVGRDEPQSAESPSFTLEPAVAAPPRRPPPSAERAETGGAQGAERAAARKVFEAKFKEPNPRLPFYTTVGVLGVLAVCTAGYFWYQLRPPPALVNTNPPPSGAALVAAATLPPTATSTQAAAAPALAQIPGLPAAPVTAPAAAASSPAAPTASSVRSTSERAGRARPAAKAPRTSAPRSRPARSELVRRDKPVSVKRPAPRVDPHVATGYAAYQAGDLARAREAYRRALGDDPANRDALLGMAAVETRAGRYDAADKLYLRLLQADPRDPHAQAGLLALRSDLTDPVAAESRVKTLLAQDPGADVLHFTLGNEYARQGRWAEAQQAYFKAFAADSQNPDFAYNVAVSLDHLRQPKLALEYYRRALALAAKRSASFDQTAARKRAQELGG